MAKSQQLVLRQRMTFSASRYDLYSRQPDGEDGPLIARADETTSAFKPQVTFHADEACTRPIFNITSTDFLAGTYAITETDGHQLLGELHNTL